MTDYGFDALRGIPDKMSPWGLQLAQPYPSDYGEYVLIEVAPADVELHHQVEVIDENGETLRGVGVMFGFPGGGGQTGPIPRNNHWRGSPAIINGNYQVTNYAGYAQHTFQSGGEDIWVWDINEDGALELPSPIVKNCRWVGTPTGRFEHTGVKLRFQKRRKGVQPRGDLLKELLWRIETLEHQEEEQAQIIVNLRKKAELSNRKITALEQRCASLAEQLQLIRQQQIDDNSLMRGNK